MLRRLVGGVLVRESAPSSGDSKDGGTAGAAGADNSIDPAEQLLDASIPPHEFLCAITYEVMEDPVTVCSGHSYEREAIVQWLENHNTDPITNIELENKDVVGDASLRASIAEWRRAVQRMQMKLEARVQKRVQRQAADEAQAKQEQAAEEARAKQEQASQAKASADEKVRTRREDANQAKASAFFFKNVAAAAHAASKSAESELPPATAKSPANSPSELRDEQTSLRMPPQPQQQYPQASQQTQVPTKVQPKKTSLQLLEERLLLKKNAGRGRPDAGSSLELDQLLAFEIATGRLKPFDVNAKHRVSLARLPIEMAARAVQEFVELADAGLRSRPAFLASVIRRFEAVASAGEESRGVITEPIRPASTSTAGPNGGVQPGQHAGTQHGDWQVDMPGGSSISPVFNSSPQPDDGVPSNASVHLEALQPPLQQQQQQQQQPRAQPDLMEELLRALGLSVHLSTCREQELDLEILSMCSVEDLQSIMPAVDAERVVSEFALHGVSTSALHALSVHDTGEQLSREQSRKIGTHGALGRSDKSRYSRHAVA